MGSRAPLCPKDRWTEGAQGTQPTGYFTAWRAKRRFTLPNARAPGDVSPPSAQAQHLWGKLLPSLQQIPVALLAVGVWKHTWQPVSG